MPIDLTTRPVRRRSSFFRLQAKAKAKEPEIREIEVNKEKYIEKLNSEEKDWAHTMSKYIKRARE